MPSDDPGERISASSPILLKHPKSHRQGRIPVAQGCESTTGLSASEAGGVGGGQGEQGTAGGRRPALNLVIDKVSMDAASTS